MKGERDIEMILSNVQIHPNEAAKKAAYERMMARQKELLTENSNDKIIELSEYELNKIAAAGLPPEEEISNGRKQESN